MSDSLKPPKPKKTKPTGTEVVAHKEFRKTNEAIGLRVSEGSLSLLSRKIFNVMVFHAQTQGVPGENAPIKSEANKNYFWVLLADIAKDAAYDSNDTQQLKDHVEELQNIRIVVEDDKSWTSERLVSSVKLVNPGGLKKRGGQVWFGFAFPPEVSNMVMSPGTYTKLSLYYQTLLRSGPALALYEIARRYATNPSKVTRDEPWEWWYGALTGNPIGETLPQYKYFKRDVLKKSIAEINTMTDLTVELIEHTAGRKIISLQFKVKLSEQQPLTFAAPPLIDSVLIERITALGIPKEEACNLSVLHSDAILKATLELVEVRMKNTTAPKLDSPAAYFKTALRSGYATPSPKEAKKVLTSSPAAAPPAPTSGIRERYTLDRAKAALELFNEIEEDERVELFAEFRVNNKSRASDYKKALEMPSIRSEFSFWYAKKTWPGEPTAEQLLSYAEEIGLR